jgi:hypothetical protein
MSKDSYNRQLQEPASYRYIVQVYTNLGIVL